ncbi:tyrosine-type recombinase/integrase [Gilvimarinus agarilyticus]|uniref:tyrosine-type recombinase/integrase n=1 Tax=Gilvimarinus sp. 2_MG-2023 TaxID=3062666 RepID=UPI001C09689A|nr:tyrosine-type recombinase/integrase [Gilvimarinus sp. 2_MG-2023]MBU2887756.1 tyrosine-type recombinase/integrase [Gilvimarinus agarilyticus]MDO6572404.1 tyrosine-type recombinase/integrase [Gilvimarinus sp. 2_MG-2023]
MSEFPSGGRDKNAARVAAGKKNVKQRSDHRVNGTLDAQAIIPRKTPHQLKIAGYRDRLLKSLQQVLPWELFERFDRRSMDMLDTVPDNTEIARYSDLCQYVEYCVRMDYPPLPFEDYVVDAYLSYMMAEGRKRSAIDRRVSSLVAWANALELDDPRASFKVKNRLGRIRKMVKNKRRQAEGLRVAHLEQALSLFDPAIARDCQDIALLFVGFETLCRQSELVRFDWEDLRLDSDGSSLLELDWHKTDQDGDGTYLYLSRNTTDLLLGWQRRSGQSSGAIFRGIYSSGKMGDRLSERGVSRCFKRTAGRLGLEPSVFSGHSNRVGAAQEMVEGNVDSAKIMLSGRWKSMAMLTQYAKRIQAKRGGMAELTQKLEWDKPRKAIPGLSKEKNA